MVTSLTPIIPRRRYIPPDLLFRPQIASPQDPWAHGLNRQVAISRNYLTQATKTLLMFTQPHIHTCTHFRVLSHLNSQSSHRMLTILNLTSILSLLIVATPCRNNTSIQISPVSLWEVNNSNILQVPQVTGLVEDEVRPLCHLQAQ